MRSTLRTESTHVRVCEFALSSDVVGEDSEDGEGAGGGDGGGGGGNGGSGGSDSGSADGVGSSAAHPPSHAARSRSIR